MNKALQQYLFSLSRSATVKTQLLICIDYVNDEIKDESLNTFVENLIEVIEDEFNDDLSNYSKEVLKMYMMLRGYDEDEIFKFICTLKKECVDRVVGIIDIKKPVDLNNLYISLLEI